MCVCVCVSVCVYVCVCVCVCVCVLQHMYVYAYTSSMTSFELQICTKTNCGLFVSDLISSVCTEVFVSTLW